MTERFKEAYKLTMAHEGAYSNDPDDRGGETYCGIARKKWPKWNGWAIVDSLKRKYPNSFENHLSESTELHNLVMDLYYKIYWQTNSCESFHQAVSIELFDTGVNQGQYAAATYLQQALNLLNRDNKDYKDLVVDGRPGKQTVAAYYAYMSTKTFRFRSESLLIKLLIKLLNYYQLRKYVKIAENNPSQEKFILGWLKRT